MNKKSNIYIAITLIAIIIIAIITFVLLRNNEDTTPVSTSEVNQEVVEPMPTEEIKTDEEDQATIVNNDDTQTVTPPLEDTPTPIEEEVIEEEVVEEEIVDQLEEETTDQPIAIEPNELPNNWAELSVSEKIALNPLNCDLETEFLWAEDGSCHAKNTDDEQTPTITSVVTPPQQPVTTTTTTTTTTDDNNDDDEATTAVCPPNYKYLVFYNIEQCQKEGEIVAKHPEAAWEEYRRSQQPPATTTTTDTNKKETTLICPPNYRLLNLHNIDQCLKNGEISTKYPADAWEEYRRDQRNQMETTDTQEEEQEEQDESKIKTPVCPPNYKYIVFHSIEQCQKSGEIDAKHPADAWEEYRQSQQTVTTTKTDDEETTPICPPNYKHIVFYSINQCQKSGEIDAKHPADAWEEYRQSQQTVTTTKTDDEETTPICPPNYKHIVFYSINQCQKSGEIDAKYPSDAWEEYRQSQQAVKAVHAAKPKTSVCPPNYKLLKLFKLDQCL